MVSVLARFPGYEQVARNARIVETSADQYYGAQYQDIVHRVPSIARAQERLGWNPKIGFEDALQRTIGHYVQKGAGRERAQELGNALSAALPPPRADAPRSAGSAASARNG
jgi:hypothetical protein